MTMTCIKAAITNHFEIFFGNMSNQTFNEINSRNGFNDEFVIFMAVVMKGNRVAIIVINARGSDDRATEIATDICCISREPDIRTNEPENIFIFWTKY